MDTINRLALRYIQATKKMTDVEKSQFLSEVFDLSGEMGDFDFYNKIFKPYLEMKNAAKEAYNQIYPTSVTSPKVKWKNLKKSIDDVEKAETSLGLWVSKLEAAEKKLTSLWADQDVLTKNDLGYFKDMAKRLEISSKEVKKEAEHTLQFETSNLVQKKNQDQTRERHDAVDAVTSLVEAAEEAWGIAYEKAHGFYIDSDTLRRMKTKISKL